MPPFSNTQLLIKLKVLALQSQTCTHSRLVRRLPVHHWYLEDLQIEKRKKKNCTVCRSSYSSIQNYRTIDAQDNRINIRMHAFIRFLLMQFVLITCIMAFQGKSSDSALGKIKIKIYFRHRIKQENIYVRHDRQIKEH